MGCVLEGFRLQSHSCGEIGSPFILSLLACPPDDIVAGRIGTQLTDVWQGAPRTAAVSLRFAEALPAAHDAVGEWAAQ
jgi:hypothetical protein